MWVDNLKKKKMTQTNFPCEFQKISIVSMRIHSQPMKK